MLNFDEIFKSPVSNNSRPNEDETLGVQRFKLKLDRHRFSFRTRNYWNLLPKRIRHMSYNMFKSETKKYFIENGLAFLNFGNKDKVVGQDLVKYVKYSPKQIIKKPRVRNENIKSLKRLYKDRKPISEAIISNFGKEKSKGEKTIKKGHKNGE